MAKRHPWREVAEAAAAAEMRPGRADLLDALIAASAKGQDAVVWTRDADPLKFLPKESVRLFKRPPAREG